MTHRGCLAVFRCAPVSIVAGLLSCILSVAIPLGALAGVTRQNASNEVDESWEPDSPKVKKWDWIRLTSGEWLKGELDRLRDDVVEFESDELDDLKIDWEDVAELHSPRDLIYRFEGFILAQGPGIMQGDTVTIQVDGEEQVFQREALVAIVPGASSERDRWTGRGSFGMTVRQGNTDQVEFSTTLSVAREVPRSRLTFDYSGTFGELEGVQNVNTHRGSSSFNLYMTRNFYVTPAYVEAFHDPFSNIRMRLTPGVGLGYHLFRGRVDWSVNGGAGYQYTVFESVQEGEDSNENSGALLLGTHFDAEVTKRVDYSVDYQLQITFPTVGDTNHNLVTTLSVELTRVLDLDVSLTWDRVEDPRPLEDGTVPEQNDYRLVVGLALDF